MKISNARTDKFVSPAVGETVLQGTIGELADKLFFHRVNSLEARKTVYQETIDAFRNRIDDADKLYGIWQGEYWGKWVISAARVARYQHNDELRSFVRSAAWELISLRDSDGCISTYRDTAFFSAAPMAEVKKLLGWECDWNWNIWCRKYTLWGLIEAAELTGDNYIMEAAEKLLEQLINTLEKKNLDIHQTGTFQGLASCSILKPVVLLYEKTGNERFKKFADLIVRGWEREDNRAPNLIRNSFTEKPITEWYPELRWTKVYEMLSCFDGLLEYYRLTGYENALKSAENMYTILLKYESNRPGCVGYNDNFKNAGMYLNSVTEPCDSIHWIRVCYELFKLTGKACYMDSFEYTFLNSFLAGIFKDGTWGMRAVRSSGRHFIVREQAKMYHNHCCVNNLPRGIINGAESCVMLSDKGAVVNLYIPFTMQTQSTVAGKVKVVVSGTYLTEGKVHLYVENEKGMSLSLRIPAWSRSAAICYEGNTQNVNSGYTELKLAAGTHDIDLTFQLHPEAAVFPYPGGTEKDSKWHLGKFMAGEKPEDLQLVEGYYATLSAGPLILSRSKLIGNSEEEMFAPSRIAEGKWTVTLTPESMPGTHAGFNAEFRSADGTVFQSKVCDFASAGNIDGKDPKLFNMFF